MSDISKIKVSGVEYDIKDSQAREDLGELSDLETEDKSNLVAAINEVKQIGESLDLTFEGGKLYVIINGVKQGNGVVIGEPGGDIDVSGVVDWYKQLVKDAYDYVTELGNDYVHNIVLADMHYTTPNFRHSIPIVQALQDTGKFGKILLLGDNADTGSSTDYDALVEELTPLTGKLLMIGGNHDHTAEVYTEYYNLTDADGVVWGDADALYYYYDDTEHKIRYIMLNSSIAIAKRATQQAWCEGLLSNLAEGWTTVICSHYAAISVYKNGAIVPSTDGTTITGNYAGVLQACKLAGDTTKFAVWLHGHYHTDAFTDMMGIRQITFNTDSKKENTANRIAGTTSEQAVSIVSINPITHDIKSYRIGYHDYQQLIEFNYAQPASGWSFGWWANSGVGWSASNIAATLCDAIQYTQGEKIWVYKRDLGAFSLATQNYNAEGTFVNSWRSSNNAWKLKTLYRNVLCASDNANFAKVFVSLDDNGLSTTAEDFENNFVITKECPSFSNWTDYEWLTDYYFNNGSIAGKEGGAVFDKIVYCEPGQTITVTLDDDSLQLGGVFAYFFNHPGNRDNSSKRFPSSYTEYTNTFSATVPDDYHYFLISGEALKQCVGHMTVTIE